LTWTKSHVKALRDARGIPAYQPPESVDATGDDTEVVTINEAERRLGVSRETLYRWLREGFMVGEQPTPNAPWRIRIDRQLLDKIKPEVPEGWVGLNEAANILGVARQTVLHKVQRGELQAVHVNRGKRKGLRIKVFSEQAGLFDTTEQRSEQC
jgi:predicted DNA-binding transcriptional regulator AlpA